MAVTTVQKTIRPQVVDATVVEKRVTTEVVDDQDFTLAKLNQVVWFLAHTMAAFLVLRFVFLILGAGLRGIVLFIYNVGSVLEVPFRGIFPSPAASGSYFDSAALLGIAMYYFLAFLLTRVLILLSRDTEA